MVQNPGNIIHLHFLHTNPPKMNKTEEAEWEWRKRAKQSATLSRSSCLHDVPSYNINLMFESGQQHDFVPGDNLLLLLNPCLLCLSLSSLGTYCTHTHTHSLSFSRDHSPRESTIKGVETLLALQRFLFRMAFDPKSNRPPDAKKQTKGYRLWESDDFGNFQAGRKSSQIHWPWDKSVYCIDWTNLTISKG